MVWFALLAGIILLVLLLYWLLVTTEGVFLGSRIVVGLYDLTAHRYDSIKEFNPVDDAFFIARSILRSIDKIKDPKLLDIAAGTGRVTLALIREPAFAGFVVGLDASARMLEQASQNLAEMNLAEDQKHAFVRQYAAPLPFPDNTFDAVCCLEALEFFPSDAEALTEMLRVLKPGSFLMTSRRRGGQARFYLNKYRSEEDFESMLRDCGFMDIQSKQWELDYDMVTAKKPGFLSEEE